MTSQTISIPIELLGRKAPASAVRVYALLATQTGNPANPETGTPGIPQRDIGEQLNYTRNVVGAAVAHLDAHGLISIEVDPTDHRARIIKLR